MSKEEERLFNELAGVDDVETAKWVNVPLKDLTMFFLKCAVASIPAVGLMYLVYVFSILTLIFSAQVLQ